MTVLDEISITPIGFIKNSLGRRRFDQWSETESELVLDMDYVDALYGLGDYSHIEVLFYLHEMDRPFKTLIHPTGNPEFPEMGAFATRTPNRPSKIALTICKILKIDNNVIRVKGLDAYNGSPILDIKPHYGGPVDDIKLPKWILNLRKGK